MCTDVVQIAEFTELDFDLQTLAVLTRGTINCNITGTPKLSNAPTYGVGLIHLILTIPTPRLNGTVTLVHSKRNCKMSPSQWAAFVHQWIIDGHDGYILGIQPCYVT